MMDIKDLAEKMMKGTIDKNREMIQREKLGSVNFQIEKTVEDGSVIRASSLNPKLLLTTFPEFVKAYTTKK